MNSARQRHTFDPPCGKCGILADFNFAADSLSVLHLPRPSAAARHFAGRFGIRPLLVEFAEGGSWPCLDPGHGTLADWGMPTVGKPSGARPRRVQDVSNEAVGRLTMDELSACEGRHVAFSTGRAFGSEEGGLDVGRVGTLGGRP